MKNIKEITKPILSGLIFAGTVGIIGLGARAAGTSLSYLKVETNNNILKAEHRDALVTEVENLKASTAVPAGAVMAFNLESCPEGWTRFAEADGRFIMGNSTNSKEKGGNTKIKLTIDQLPPHSFKLKIENNKRGDNADHREFARNWGSSSSSNTISTNTIGAGKEIDITNPYIKLLYCKKN